MEEKNELSDILLANDASDKSQKTKRILVIIALLMLLFIIILVIMKIINKSDEPTSIVGDNLVPNTTQQENKSTVQQSYTDINIEDNNSNVIVDSFPDDVEIPKISDIQEVKEPTLPNVDADGAPIKTPVDPKPVTTTKKPVTTKPNVSKPATKPVSQSSTVVQKAYYIQVGSIQNSGSLSKSFVKKIEQNNYKYTLYKTVVNTKNVNKILIGPFNSQQDARAALPKIRKDIANDAFLYQIP